MLTVTIESEDGKHKSIREWPDCDIVMKGSERFIDMSNAEFGRLREEFDIEVAAHLSGQYKAFMLSTCGEFRYLLTLDQTAYITNSSGKTVAVVK